MDSSTDGSLPGSQGALGGWCRGGRCQRGRHDNCFSSMFLSGTATAFTVGHALASICIHVCNSMCITVCVCVTIIFAHAQVIPV